jgi:hypothetical protein
VKEDLQSEASEDQLLVVLVVADLGDKSQAQVRE